MKLLIAIVAGAFALAAAPAADAMCFSSSAASGAKRCGATAGGPAFGAPAETSRASGAGVASDGFAKSAPFAKMYGPADPAPFKPYKPQSVYDDPNKVYSGLIKPKGYQPIDKNGPFTPNGY